MEGAQIIAARTMQDAASWAGLRRDGEDAMDVNGTAQLSTATIFFKLGKKSTVH